MGDKKSKALALELMEDLLNEDSKTIEVEGFNGNKPEDLMDVPDAESTRAFGEHLSENSATLNLNSEDNGDHTLRIDTEEKKKPTITQKHPQKNHERSPDPRSKSKPKTTPQSGAAEDRVRASVGRFAPYRASGSTASSTEAALAQSESLRIAQNRLLEYEQEIERLRLQNEELAAAAETLRRRTDELSALNQKRESDYQNAVSTFEQEREILVGVKEGLQRDMESIKQRNEELELRISSNIQKIRVRERELENRLELVKMESAALIRSKDEMILELKRNIDQLNLELNNYRSKNQELNRQTSDKQEQLRRTVKALRLALSMLEGEEEAPKGPAAPVRKAK
jgi:DNA repair exonuclease SbcCD ATPase subunit